MDIHLKSSIRKEVLQIQSKLKTCPSPQGGIFLFLLNLLILEDCEQEESLEITNTILIDKEIDFMKEWDYYVELLCFLVEPIRNKKQGTMDSQLKNMPVNFEAIKGTPITLEELQSFRCQYRLLVTKREDPELKKMLGTEVKDHSILTTKIKTNKNGNR